MKSIILIAASRSGHNFIRNMIEAWIPGVKTFNWENARAEDYSRTLFAYEQSGQIEDPESVLPVIVVRDLLNWWASYWSWIHTKGFAERNYQNMFDVWISHAREAASLTRYISNATPVYYDFFKESRFHREGICQRLGGEYNEHALDLVPQAGDGSSFDGFAVPGSQMRTTDRYKQMNGKDEWMNMLRKRPDAVEVYRRRFNLDDDKLKIINQL